jgi:hypothetical protein
MPSNAGTLETLALEIGHALAPLKDLLGPEFFVNLGLELPREIAGDAPLRAALSAAKTKAGELEPRIASLAGAITGGDSLAIIGAGVPLLATVAELVVRLADAGTALDQAANALPPAARAALQDLGAKLAMRTLEAMGVSYLDTRLPSLTAALSLLGLLDIAPRRGPGMEVSYSPRQAVAPRLYLDRLPQLLQHPDQYLQQTFRWGDAAFDGSALLSKVQMLLEGLGVPAAIYTAPGSPPTLEAFVFAAQADNSVSPPGLKFDLSLPGSATFDRTVDFSALWKGTVHAEAQFAAGLEVGLRPPFTLSARPPSGNVALKLGLGLKAEKSASDPIVLLGVTGGTRLTARSMGGAIGIDAALGPGGGEVAPTLQLRIDDGQLVIDFSEGDGFIQQLLSGVHLEAGFGLVADWNPRDGLRLQGQGGVEVFVPLHLDLAVVLVNGLYLSVGFGTPAPLTIGLATQLTAHLGPLVAVVDRIGVRSAISFPAGGGNLGLADIAFAFQPPRGVGLSIDTGVIKGGGFLSLDFEKGEYFGALELSFQGVIALKAVGIINTKMPDGRPGFALLILITAEFTPIQLGFGFTLNGVGGLLGANRTASVDALKAGVRTGALSSVLFPQDVVANITRIVSDLQAIFPIAQDHFLIGPMAKLGWGTPTLISLELGIIIDIPVPRIIILGVLRCILPTEQAAILKLQVNFAGGIDFDQGMIWFDASLFDSSILVYTLTGDMALRIGWKDPMFVLSVGGFHPAFKEVPADLTGMRRIMLSLMSGNNPRLTAQTYFAVTSNSVQNGSRVELYAEACGFNIYGYLGYDLLVQFSPFHFIAEIAAGLALRQGTSEIAGIHVRCQLAGPTPWHAEGEASLTILFFEISVGFSETWGETGPSQPLETEDVLALVKAALEDKRNWKADQPANATQGVSLRKLQLADDDIVVHPFGILSVSQKVVPLGLPIDKFGLKKPLADTLFELTTAETGTEEVREEFALGNFKQMNDSEKVSRKSFERLRSGLRLTPQDGTAHGFEVQKDVDYELSYVHRKKNLFLRGGLVRMFTGIFATLVKGGSASANTFSVAKRAAVCAPAKVEVATPQYMVVNVSDLALHAAGMSCASQAEALALHDAAVAAEPALRGKLQVVSEFELS